MMRARRLRPAALFLAAALVVGAGACSPGDDDDATPDADADVDVGDPGDCVVVDMAISPEKIDLMTELSRDFNATDAEVDGDCVFVRPQRKASGAAAQALARGWDESIDGPPPVVWSPAASTWGAVVNQQLVDRGEEPIVGDGEPFMLTPLVIAMPEPMAEALGWPATPIGWSDILNLARNAEGWAAFGHPEWGAFKLGKTNPNFSTSGLNALVAQTYAATGKTSGLSAEDLDRPDVIDFATTVESSVVHYGDTTLTFLNNWYRADQRGTALTYVSAAAVEEKSVIDYNSGNPDGVLEPGEEPRPPRVPLVAIYPRRARSSPTTRSWRSTPTGSHPRSSTAPGCSPSSCNRPTSRSRCSSSASVRAIPRSPSPRRSPPTTASTPTSPRPCSRCRSRA